MKTKIAMSLGLVLVMFLGVYASMLALGVFGPSQVQAAPIADATGDPDLNLVVPGDIPIPLASAVHINARALNLMSPATIDDANLTE